MYTHREKDTHTHSHAQLPAKGSTNPCGDISTASAHSHVTRSLTPSYNARDCQQICGVDPPTDVVKAREKLAMKAHVPWRSWRPFVKALPLTHVLFLFLPSSATGGGFGTTVLHMPLFSFISTPQPIPLSPSIVSPLWPVPVNEVLVPLRTGPETRPGNQHRDLVLRISAKIEYAGVS
jgi:hypothetical protein